MCCSREFCKTLYSIRSHLLTTILSSAWTNHGKRIRTVISSSNQNEEVRVFICVKVNLLRLQKA